MIKIYIDAATNQNKQLSAGGMIIIKDKKQKWLDASGVFVAHRFLLSAIMTAI